MQGEYVRVALVMANVRWKDRLIDQRDWPTLKNKTPNGYLPTLKEEGKPEVKDQEMALVRYICHKHNMYPDNPEDRYKAERVVDIITNDCKFYPDNFF